ncbi:unnamed protein product [Kuraishia capsulata CBS 1993]|uniref:Peptidase S54 rhomboid domain-containing protein n=1 Tax=Kuraishia capsulata CBS 1993 TaxID=1382522 RepID=W6MXL9_9ASCO|nr:uncharacterized protein KUCA_T00005107001 [Kuraishia capsulata CBS 1993]CDK29120.1 unnamed protein product [Kuraishia capsulata CBS 1993]
MNRQIMLRTTSRWFFSGNLVRLSSTAKKDGASMVFPFFQRGVSFANHFNKIQRATKTPMSHLGVKRLTIPYGIVTRYGQISNLRSVLSNWRTFATHRQLNFSYSRFGGSRFNSLVGPLVFTIAFGLGTHFLAPYAVQLVPARLRQPVVLYSIIGLNVLVFMAWRSNQFGRVLYRYFLLDKQAMWSNWSMLGSAFSHQDFWHILFNLWCLYSFSTTLIQVLGPANFLEVYLNGAVISSLASLAYPKVFRLATNSVSLGASGAVCAIFGVFTALFPTANVSLWFVPIWGGASTAFGGFAIYNILGCIFKFGSLDYAAHLGGMAAGLVYGYYYKQKAQKRRQRATVWGF